MSRVFKIHAVTRFNAYAKRRIKHLSLIETVLYVVAMVLRDVLEHDHFDSISYHIDIDQAHRHHVWFSV